MSVKITDIYKDKAQVVSNLDNFVKVIPNIMLSEIDGAYFINVLVFFFWEANSRSGGHGWKRHDRQKILVLSLVFLTRWNPLLNVAVFLAGKDLKFLLDSEAQRRECI